MLAADLRAVADEHRATQALGVSLGAGTLLRLLAETPDRFTRVVLFLPASLDTLHPGPVRRSADLLAALQSDDLRALEQTVRAELPADLAPEAVAVYVAARASYLRGCDLVPLLRALEGMVPVPDRAALGVVTAEVLVLAQEQDPVHPVEVAREIAAALPRGRLEVFPRAGVLFRPAERARLRRLVVEHLGAG